MKTILVPTDFSKQAEYALQMACQLANKGTASIRLLHVISHPQRILLNASGQIDMDDPMENEFIRETLKRAQGQMKYLVKRCKGVSVKTEIRIGDPHADVVDDILRSRQDLIILGAPGYGKEDESEHTIKIVRSATCPVISVKSPVNLDEIKEIILATNLLEDQPRMMAALKEMADLLQIPIRALKVLTANDLPPDGEQKALMLEFVSKYGLQPQQANFIHAATEPQGVLEYTESRPGSIIALGTHGRKGLAHFLSGSVAEELATQAFPPVWTFHLQS